MKTLPVGVRLGGLVIGCLLVVVLALIASHAPVGAVLQKLLLDSFQSPSSMMDTLKRFCPYLIAGVAVFWSLRAGLFNIGVEGQFMMGGLAAMAVALPIGGMGGIIAGTLAGMLAGMLWALPAAWIKAYRGGHEVISTIMLNQIAILLAGHLVSGPLMDKNAGFPTTATLKPESMLAGIPMGPVTFSWAILIGIAIVGAFTWWLRRTVSGFELSVTGANPTAGRFAGIEVRKTVFQALLYSGGVAGLGGALQAVAFEGRFFEGFSSGYGFDALGVAILAGSNPIGIIPSAFAFAVLQQGALAVQMDNVPRGIGSVILALLVVVFSAFRYAKVKLSHE